MIRGVRGGVLVHPADWLDYFRGAFLAAWGFSLYQNLTALKQNVAAERLEKIVGK